jgi:hypothetical protein
MAYDSQIANEKKLRLAQEIGEMLLSRERQERAEDMTADGGVGGMEDRPGAHDRLGPAEEVLDIPFMMPLII